MTRSFLSLLWLSGSLLLMVAGIYGVFAGWCVIAVWFDNFYHSTPVPADEGVVNIVALTGSWGFGAAFYMAGQAGFRAWKNRARGLENYRISDGVGR